MIVYSHVNSIFNSISYRFGNVLIDPGDSWDGFLSLDTVLLTHAHLDHIYGLNRVLELNPDVKVFTNKWGKEALLNDKLNLSRFHGSPFVFNYPNVIRSVEDGEKVNLKEGLVAKAMFTPGHNPSCITWIIGNKVFTGDSYIPGVGIVTNLPRGNKIQAAESEKRILELSSGKTVYPGHKV